MKDYNNPSFEKILKQIVSKEEYIVQTKLSNIECTFLQYFLTQNLYYAIIVDDYSQKISDKNSLIEALYYQVKLVTINGLNWDALQEGFEVLIDDNLIDFEGICLLFKHGSYLKSIMQNEFKILIEIIQAVNKQFDEKKITILLN